MKCITKLFKTTPNHFQVGDAVKYKNVLGEWEQGLVIVESNTEGYTRVKITHDTGHTSYPIKTVNLRRV